MKTLLALFILLLTNVASADLCTVVIRDQYGYEFDSFTRSSYSSNAACDDAAWDCQQRLSEYQTYGQFYNAVCVIRDITPTYPTPSYPPSYPTPYPPSYPPSYPPTYPSPYPPRYPDPHEPRWPRRPDYPAPRDPRGPGREPPRHEPGSEPRYPGYPVPPRRPR